MSLVLTLGTVIDWLSSIAPTPPDPPWPPFMEGPYIHDMPDRVVHVSMLPGLGWAMDGAVDQPSFQVRVRGDQHSQADAENVALQIDQAIYNQHFPQQLNGVNFVIVTRQAGTPAPLGPPDDGFRYEYVCTYRTMIGALANA
jgi:hypothetical protein